MLLLFSILAMVASYNVHQLLSLSTQNCTWSLPECIHALAIPAVRHWFFLLEGLAVLGVCCMTFGREHIKYRSRSAEIVPGVHTPEAEGQGQYGTARWMRPDEFSQAFTTVTIDAASPALRKLISLGRADLEGDGP